MSHKEDNPDILAQHNYLKSLTTEDFELLWLYVSTVGFLKRGNSKKLLKRLIDWDF
jgi:hypothetical protein